MANVSLVTGKTWEEMNKAERLAHTIARGTTQPSVSKDSAAYKQAQQILQESGFSEAERQQALRDEAIDRIAAGQGQVGLQDAIRAGGYQNYQDYAQSGGQQQSSQGMLTQGPLVFGATGQVEPTTYGFQETPQPMFQSTDQYRQFEAVSAGGTRFNPDGTINKEWFNSLSPEEASQLWYEGTTGGFGVGDNQIHRNMRASLEEAYNERFPRQAPTGPLVFGGGETVGGQGATQGTSTAAPTEASQAPQLNANFIAFLESLGLGSLVDLFTSGQYQGGTGGGSGMMAPTYTPYQPMPAEVQPIDYSAEIIPPNAVGYDPIRGLYQIPNPMQGQTVANQTRLFEYIYNR